MICLSLSLLFSRIFLALISYISAKRDGTDNIIKEGTQKPSLIMILTLPSLSF